MVFVCIPVIEYVAVNAENSYSYGDINGDGDINTKRYCSLDEIYCRRW